MDEFLDKKYQQTNQNNFEDYLVYTGVNYLGRKIALTLKPVQSLHRNNDGTYTFRITSSYFNWEIVFTPGIEFEETKPDGSKVRAKFLMNDNIMTHIQVDENGIQSKHVIEFYPDKNIVTTTATGLEKVVTRHYTLVS
ncbi:fatty acid-binding protein-like [Galleria mellonella]|uniref:Fatty acid-binding protein-like n=1 Tax=Galleria mellonella TaxID=7137 RepID=A0A6J1WRW0_GALME|nr:fatty acid-binding protein-like [Galleria mellonella]